MKKTNKGNTTKKTALATTQNHPLLTANVISLLHDFAIYPADLLGAVDELKENAFIYGPMAGISLHEGARLVSPCQTWDEHDKGQIFQILDCLTAAVNYATTIKYDAVGVAISVPGGANYFLSLCAGIIADNGGEFEQLTKGLFMCSMYYAPMKKGHILYPAEMLRYATMWQAINSILYEIAETIQEQKQPAKQA